MLAQHLAKPLFQFYEFGQSSMADTAPVLGKFIQKMDKVDADGDAVKFYLLNHVFGLIQSKYDNMEALPPNVATLSDLYVEESSKMFLRAFYYLYIITAREARHLNNNVDMHLDHIEKTWGLPCRVAMKKIVHGNSSKVVDLLTTGADVKVLDFVEALQYVFHKGHWSSAYGGKAWGKVTDCLYMLLAGKTTPEMMLDTIWTLAHNNGPIFNKPYLYSGYSQLGVILDIQRSGQIPQLLHDSINNNNVLGCSGVTHQFPLYKKIIQLVDWPELRGYLDWYKVEALGSVKSYGGHKQAQKAKHGMSPYDKDAVAMGKSGKAGSVAGANVAKAAKSMKKAIDSLSDEYYTIGPDKYKKLKRGEW